MIKIKKQRPKRNYTDPNEPRHASAYSILRKKQVRNFIKVLSYNIKHGKKIEKAITMLKEHPDLDETDIICLQEMDPKGVRRMAHELKYNFVYYPAIFHPRLKKDFGNAILSKGPISNDKKIILPNSKRQRLQRIAVRATVSIRGKKIAVFSVHMKIFLNPNSRSDQIDTLLNEIPNKMTACIIAGDFNTFTKANRNAVRNPLEKAKFKLATEKAGWSYKHWYLLNKKDYLDHIYTRGMSVLKTGKILKRKSSDHYPLWADLEPL